MTRTGLALGLGVFGGGIATLWLSRYLERVNWYDPIAFVDTTLLVPSIAFVACYIPARRASRVDPMIVLREE